jgi:hypothetical protein
MIIDISEQVMARYQYQNLPKKNRFTFSIKKQMISWLEQNVGAYQIEITAEHGRSYVGAGWEWGSRSETVGLHFQTTWFVKINDEAAATMFRLKFL